MMGILSNSNAVVEIDKLSKGLNHLFGIQTPITNCDYVLIIYLILLLIWVITFIIKAITNLRSYWMYNNGVLALHKATFDNKTQIARGLIKKYPEAINKIIDSDGFTPFLRACHNGNTELVKMMIEYGADLKSQTARLENPFFLAVHDRLRNKWSRDATCIHTLYHAGVDINAPNINGLNVLQMAAMFGHSSLIKWLLSKNVILNVNPSPFLLAKLGGYKATANCLRELYGLEH